MKEWVILIEVRHSEFSGDVGALCLSDVSEVRALQRVHSLISPNARITSIQEKKD